MKKMIAMLSVATLLAVTGYADQQMNKSKKSQNKPPFEQGLELPEGKYPQGYNAPACVDVKGWDFDVWGSFTYWNVNQEAMDVAFIAMVPSATAADVVNGKTVTMGSNWTPGFKVGASFNTNYDGWVSSAEYTWLRSSTSVSAKNTTGDTDFDYATSSLFPFFTSFGSQFSSDWDLHLDQLDVLFSRPYYQATRITITPFAGLRALWIRQHQTLDGLVTPESTSTPVGPASVSARSQCWSIGPAAGFSGHWLLGQGFRFEGSTTASLLYTQYTKLSFKMTTVGNLPNLGKLSDVSALRPTAEFGIGLGWGTYLCDQNYFIDFSARYDFKYFWAQNMERWFTSTAGGYQGNEIGALMVHGLTLSGGFDF